MFKTSKVILVSLSHFVHDIYSSFIAPFLPILIKNLSLNYSQAAMLNIAFRAPSLINPFLGIIADKVNLKLFLTLGPFITAICMCYLAECPTYESLVFLLFFCGINVMLYHIPAPVMIKHLSGEKTGKGMSFYMLGGEGARFLGPLIFVWAITFWGVHRLYYLLIPAALATFFLYYKLKDENIKEQAQEKIVNIKAFHTFKKHLTLIFAISGIYFSAGILKAIGTTFLPTYYTSQGKSLMIGGFALAIVQFFGAIGVLAFGTLSDKYSHKKLLIISVICSSLFLTGLNLANNNYFFSIFCLTGFGLSTFANGPILLSIVNNADQNNPAFINAIFMALNLGINALTAFSTGKLFDLYGFTTTFFIGALLNLICIPFIFLIKRKEII